MTSLLQCNDLPMFIKEVMRRRRCRQSKLAADLGVSHATIGRWLRGEDVPNIHSCRKLALYSDMPFDYVLSLAHRLPGPLYPTSNLPAFREYMHLKYPNKLDEDLITVVENLLERGR